MHEQASLMSRETEESPVVVARLLQEEAATFKEIARIFDEKGPSVITTAARGSSAHAATFFKYLMEMTTGVPVSPIGPSLASVYKTKFRLRNALHFTVSQSGASPDIVAAQEAAKQGGATTIAVVNVADSPLANAADIVVKLHAGAEKSVAATKSFIASVAALSGIVAAISGDERLKHGLSRLPDALANTVLEADSGVEELLARAHSLFTAGRGTGFAIALEAALKAKETANIHAEGFSLAEVMHGPMRLIETGFPIVAFVPNDAALQTNLQAVELFQSFGARTVALSNHDVAGLSLPFVSTGCAHLDPLVSLINYYRIIESVTRRKGFDPDKPRNLNKVTVTV